MAAGLRAGSLHYVCLSCSLHASGYLADAGLVFDLASLLANGYHLWRSPVIELILALISLALGSPLWQPPDQTGYVTQFGGENDKHATEPALCLGRRTRHTDWGIATRGGRCGDLYILRNPKNGKWVLVPRIDSGPWLAVKMSCRKGKACRLEKNGSKVMPGAPRIPGYWYGGCWLCGGDCRRRKNS